MFAIAFDLCIADLQQAHPKGKGGVSEAYAEVRKVMSNRGFEWIQGSVYTTDEDSMAVVFLAIEELKAISWFPAAVRDVRAFRIENWSDFTDVVKG